ncbi:MAG: glycosyltransferase family protein [Alphaproteobacteria bacterium]
MIGEREAATEGWRLLIYSHDSFGLGHLRRCREIAHSLAEAYQNLSVLILSGSPIIGSFDFRPRVDFVRIPGMIKLSDGNYSSHALDIAADKTLELRAAIIRETALIFEPDIFLVDKEPLGLRGEVRSTLELLQEQGCQLVLGLRDVMDDPESLAPEWTRKGAPAALRDFYDEVWVYGLPQICDPLEGIDLADSVRRKMTFTGYLRRSVTTSGDKAAALVGSEPYVLVTPGGGGDGEALVDWVIRAYETQPKLLHRALIVFGPFMQGESQADFRQRIEALPNVEAITFDAHLETLIAGASGVVAMGGYNTFCEILSFDKPAIIVPRSKPRLEQTIRADRAQELGLVRMLDPNGSRDARAMATAIRQLPQQGRPSDVVVPGLLDGLDNVERLVGRALSPSGRKRLRFLATGG